ncbi:CDP-alcohol phosphatidyltransferase family protein [Cryptosporangium sp. NPDC051539]|uniref:CDP-alcohol phosphatidyltransferase family protein n=1 Tax=Cryptosporangium sp. NPDC051539 TaxID=3363962 RepID=UPI0037B88316
MSTPVRDRLTTVPNVVTIVRTVAAVTLAVAALTRNSAILTVAAFLCYWIGDMLDGLSARLLNQETRVGAVLDIVADRACCGVCASALLVVRPEFAIPVAVFLGQFLVVDCMLSLSFIRWPILGPNYFAAVHRGVYRWNWWPPAKVANTAGCVVLVVAAPSPWWATAFAVFVLAIKAVSLRTVARLASP